MTPIKREIWLKWTIGLLLVTVILKSLATAIADLDLWGYLAFGRLFWESGHFPYQDVFSYVPTLNPWVYHEWLTGVLFYPLYQKLGDPGLQTLRYVLGLGTMGLIYLTARARGATSLAIILLIFMTKDLLSMGYGAVRAQVFTYFFFALTLYLLETARQTSSYRRLWLLVLILIPWCNLHGGFLAGLGLMGFYAVGEAISRRPYRPYLKTLLISGLVTLLNPYGLDYWTYLIRAISMPRPEITEWASLFQAYRTGIIPNVEFFYILAVIIFAFMLIWWTRWRDFTAILTLGFTLYLGLKHSRHEIFFLLSLGAYVPVLLDDYLKVLWTKPLFTSCNRLGWKIPTLVAALFSVVFTYQFLSQSPFSLKIPPQPDPTNKQGIYYPVGALDFIQDRHLSGKLLTHFNWGEYLLWNLYPDCKVALDGRYETVYPHEVAEKYFEFILARADWQQFLDSYPPDMLLLINGSEICRLIHGDPGWRAVYADTGSALFLRQASLRK